MTILDTANDTRPDTWTDACPLGQLIPGRGVAVLLPTGTQAAVFLLSDGSLHAICNIDPSCKAAVLSRGLVVTGWGSPRWPPRCSSRCSRCAPAGAWTTTRWG